MMFTKIPCFIIVIAVFFTLHFSRSFASSPELHSERSFPQTGIFSCATRPFRIFGLGFEGIERGRDQPWHTLPYYPPLLLPPSAAQYMSFPLTELLELRSRAQQLPANTAALELSHFLQLLLNRQDLDVFLKSNWQLHCFKKKSQLRKHSWLLPFGDGEVGHINLRFGPHLPQIRVPLKALSLNAAYAATKTDGLDLPAEFFQGYVVLSFVAGILPESGFPVVPVVSFMKIAYNNFVEAGIDPEPLFKQCATLEPIFIQPLLMQNLHDLFAR